MHKEETMYKPIRFFMLSALVSSVLFTGYSAKAPAATQAFLQFTSSGHALGFSADGMYAATGSHALHVGFAGAGRVQPQADAPTSMEGKTASLNQVTYPNLWKGITLTYTATEGSIYTTTYTLTPGANPNDIRLSYNVPLSLNTDGTLSIAFETGTLTETTPFAWQEVDGERVEVDVAFQVKGREVAFALGAYDPHYPLTIDPTLLWNTFLGGSGNDGGSDIAVDSSGNIYVAGSSSASWGSPKRAYTSGTDTFVAKLNSSGNLLWNTFLGGSGDDGGGDIAVDSSGNIYVTGSSAATWGSPLRAYTKDYDAFVARLNSSGSLVWNTFLGGNGWDVGVGIDVDGNGNIYVTGSSYPSWGSPKRPYGGSGDAFAAKLNTSGDLLWNTFLGGSGEDIGSGIAVDWSGNVYMAGLSDATWGSPVRDYTSGRDAFVTKLNTSGDLLWNTFLGGSGTDHGSSIAVDDSGSIYVVGISYGTWSSPKRAYTSGFDAFAAKLNSSGNLLWNTFLGGNLDDYADDYADGIAVDGSGNVYVAGESSATWGSPVRAYTSGWDSFAAQLNSSGSLLWNTFLGGSGYDWSSGIAVDGSGYAYVVGTSDITWGSPVRDYTNGKDAFVAKLDKMKTASYRSGADYDGWVLESNETSNLGGTKSAASTVFNLGDDAKDRQYRAILSFDTSALPDTAVITKVTLKIKRQGLVGTDPFTTHGNLLVDVRMGKFSDNVALQPSDFEAAACKNAVGSIPKTPVSGWYTKTWTSGIFTCINKTGLTQLRLRFNKDDNDDTSADYLKFYSGDAGTASQRPQLIVEYYVP
jgi:hypothetical protein